MCVVWNISTLYGQTVEFCTVTARTGACSKHCALKVSTGFNSVLPIHIFSYDLQIKGQTLIVLISALLVTGYFVLGFILPSMQFWRIQIRNAGCVSCGCHGNRESFPLCHPIFLCVYLWLYTSMATVHSLFMTYRPVATFDILPNNSINFCDSNWFIGLR